jgi:two-component system nitrate/nitrite response regulator NarL
MPNRINLYVVDDHALFREGLLRLLESDPVLRIVGSAGSAEAALKNMFDRRIDIVILDYDLGDDETALPLVRTLRERGFGGKILVVTAGLPNRDALELIRLGIAGIFPKQHPPEELHRSILSVAQGKVLIDQEYLQRLVDSAMVTKDVPLRLTERDRRILRLLLEGLSNKEIAAELHVSESAVKSSLQALFARTGVRTRSQLVRIVLEQLRDEL